MDWAGLNTELVRLIAKKVGDISNFIRFRAVCKHWRLAVPPSDLPQQLPYFIQCERKSKYSSFDIQFSSFFAKKKHTLQIQNSQLKGRPLLFGSLNGYVLLGFLQSLTWLLLNPLTGFQVPLPFPFDYLLPPIYFGPSCTPNSVENEIDVVSKSKDTLTEDFLVCLWRYVGGKWTKFTEVHCRSNEYLRFTNGRLYAFSILNRDARVIDVTTGGVISLIPGSSKKIDYLTEAYGDLLGVSQHITPSDVNLSYPGSLVEVYQLEDAVTNPCWVKVNCIGDQMLFLSLQGNCLCLKASDFEGCKGNSVYMIDFSYDMSWDCCLYIRYDMESKARVPLDIENYYCKWFVPSLF